MYFEMSRRRSVREKENDSKKRRLKAWKSTLCCEENVYLQAEEKLSRKRRESGVSQCYKWRREKEKCLKRSNPSKAPTTVREASRRESLEAEICQMWKWGGERKRGSSRLCEEAHEEKRREAQKYGKAAHWNAEAGWNDCVSSSWLMQPGSSESRGYEESRRKASKTIPYLWLWLYK